MQAGATGAKETFTSVGWTRATGEMETRRTNVRRGSALETVSGHAVGTKL
jgi:hypothetical protein